MADPITFRRTAGRNGPQLFPFSPQRRNLTDRLLLGLVWDKLAGGPATEAEGDLAAKIAAARLLVGLHLPDPLPNAITLGLSKGGVAAQVEQMGGDARASTLSPRELSLTVISQG
jgi:hypothetical protein